MNNQKFDDRLIKVLEKEALKERWQKKLRITGEVIRKKITKKGSFMLTIKTRKYEYSVVIPKHRKNEYNMAKNTSEGEFVKVTGEKNIDIIFCDRIQKLNKYIQTEKQMKLFA